MTTKILFNPNCTKCRLTLELLNEKNIDASVVEYLTTPPTVDELKDILGLLSMDPRELMRTFEAPYKDKGLDNPDLTDDELIQGMVDNPILIERPIVISNGRAAIGRPPETVLNILD